MGITSFRWLTGVGIASVLKWENTVYHGRGVQAGTDKDKKLAASTENEELCLAEQMRL